MNEATFSAAGGSGAGAGRILLAANNSFTSPTLTNGEGLGTFNGQRTTNAFLTSALATPYLPDTVGGPAALGKLIDSSGFEGKSQLDALKTTISTNKPLSFASIDSSFVGFDEIFISNLTNTPVPGIGVTINGIGTETIGTLAPGESWTTLVPDGNTQGLVSVDSAWGSESFNSTGLGSNFIVAVPEPSTFILLGIGAISLLVGWGRRKRCISKRLTPVLAGLILVLFGIGSAKAIDYQFVKSIGGPNFGTGHEQFYAPCGVAVDSSGNIWVADTYNHRIQKFDSNGTFLRSLNGQFGYPRGITVDSSDNVWVGSNGCVQKFSNNGVPHFQFGTTGSGEGQIIDASALVVDSSGNVWVADYVNQRIQRFNSTGAYLGKVNGQFNNPMGVTLDLSGHIWATDQHNHRIQEFDTSGTFLRACGTRGSEDGQFEFPYGIATDHSGNIWATDAGNHRVMEFDSNGTYISQFDLSVNGQFTSPTGLAFDSGGNLWVADFGSHSIQLYAPVPEPSTFLLLGIGAISIFIFRIDRVRKNILKLTTFTWSLGVILMLMMVTTASSQFIHVEAVIDGSSELVIDQGSLYWHHISWAKPGNYGTSYEITGPTYIDSNSWTPEWGNPNPRVTDNSSTYPIDTTGFHGFSLSSQYGHEFDSYPEYVSGQMITLADTLNLNRGSVYLSQYLGLPTIRIDDPFNGQNVYSFNIAVPEPSTILLLGIGAISLLTFGWRRLRRSA